MAIDTGQLVQEPKRKGGCGFIIGSLGYNRTHPPPLDPNLPSGSPALSASHTQQTKTETHNTKRSVHPTSWAKLMHSRWTNTEVLLGDTQWPGSSVCTDSCTMAEPGEPKSKLSSRPNHAYLRCDAVKFYWAACRTQPAAHLCHPDHVSGRGHARLRLQREESRPPRTMLPTDSGASRPDSLSKQSSGWPTTAAARRW